MNNITTDLIAFRDARDWAQFHTAPHIASALAVEAAELQETMLWGRDPGPETVLELADVLIYAYLLAHTLGVDPESIMRVKMELNAEKYPA